jgi:glycosyltransferase involved in cell wall biosynthesis
MFFSTKIFIWFADYHALLPVIFAKIFNKKVYLVIGGYDAVSLPEFNYGAHRSRLRSSLIGWICNHVDFILPVSHFIKEQLLKNIQGLVNERVHVVWNGIDTHNFIKTQSFEHKKRQVVCVAVVDSDVRYQVKGVDRFVELAEKCPNYEFILVGVNTDFELKLSSLRIPNLKMIQKVNRTELLDIYAESMFVCQFSRIESFGIAMIEGILNQCLPLTIAGTASTELLGSKFSEYVFDAFDTDEICKKMNAFETDFNVRVSELQTMAIENFSTIKRENALIDLLSI